MKFLQYVPDLYSVEKVIADGEPDCGNGLYLSHLPGNRTPTHLKADVSVESALRAIADPSEPLRGHGIVTNDHMDTDGVLTIWTLLNPTLAPEWSRQLIDAAQVSDFQEWTTPAALQIDLTVRAVDDPERSPLATDLTQLSEAEQGQRITEYLLDRLPELLRDPHPFWDLWSEAYAEAVQEMNWALGGGVEVTEYPHAHLSVLTTDRVLEDLTRNSVARGQRILEIERTPDGYRYDLGYRNFLFYDTVTRFATPRHMLTAAADRLNELEPDTSSGHWAVADWYPALWFASEDDEEAGFSQLHPDTVSPLVLEELERLDWLTAGGR
ncbi:DUF6687 family protein [Streptomyces sp. NBC_00154]|uniref:DUF6687 family protein n=1 Tax=Streptomyces sp. NBC_00154 TaxID=2975670 RepID=UPI002253E185|nr:DUF6687 family protein [Streptomyces sp. NBC_00154]MCX5315976.1 hypothetical protein [Streptomyces sp. NBC_00154]